VLIWIGILGHKLRENASLQPEANLASGLEMRAPLCWNCGASMAKEGRFQEIGK
jgi:hypothetical protein